ncbi:hypothetical protein ACUXAV_004301 [Cupriavidus metallidurans]|jgi:hypothetical protein|nr:hypothetical protein AU374_04301 [Cupriavidus metallidurans]
MRRGPMDWQDRGLSAFWIGGGGSRMKIADNGGFFSTSPLKEARWNLAQKPWI